jgi:hypothetical protein
LTRLEDRFLEAELREDELRLTALLEIELDLERDTDELREEEDREEDEGAARVLEREISEEERVLEDEELRFGLE